MAKNEEHKLDTKFINLHIKIGRTGGGACLNRHKSEFSENHSCSHRWQAYLKAKECWQWYNYPAYQDLVKTSVKKIFKTTQWGHFITSEKRPEPFGWDLTATTSYTSRKVKNFVSWSKCPYWHQAHHIIPNGVLNNCIADAANESIKVHTLTRVCLLQAKYNLNHKKNVILLPMGKEVAAALGLPRHIAGIEGDASGKHYMLCHPKYTNKVTSEVKKVIRGYAKQIDTQEHETNNPELDKSKLENISVSIFNRLRSWQKKAKQGAPADDMPM